MGSADPRHPPFGIKDLVAGGGQGLEAMRARTQRAGGTARSGPHDGGWLVELEVPA